jgi:hypothetical protein
MPDLTIQALEAFNAEYHERYPRGGDEEDHHYAQVAAMEAAIAVVQNPQPDARIYIDPAPEIAFLVLSALPTYAKVKFKTEATNDRPPIEGIFRGVGAEGKFWITATMEFFVDPAEITYLEVADR